MTAVQQAPPTRQEPRRRPGPRRFAPRTAAARIRALAALVVVALAATLAATWIAVSDARHGMRVIGHDAGPQVVATSDLYFQLTDMDAQLATALLIGGSQGLGVTRDQALARYDQDRAKAAAALLQAAKLADEPSEAATAQAVVMSLGAYERIAGQALLLDRQAGHTAGPPSSRVLDLYRQATDLMKLDVLPKAYNLTLDDGTLVRHTYEDERAAVRAGIVAVVVTGLLLVALLVVLQVFLTRRFRRLLNPALALATLVALALTGTAAAVLSGQAADLRRAKVDGFDSVLALSRARAIGNSANADQTRFLLDPERADTYEQQYMTKAQSVLYLKAGNLAAYNQAVQRQAARTGFLGFLGAEAARRGVPGQDAAFGAVLTTYKAYQADDRRIRDLVAAGRRDEAVRARLDAAAGSSSGDFATYDRALVKLIGIHRTAFDDAVRDGDGGTRHWDAGLPVAGLVIVALVLAGVRPRLAEYR
ncbi:hypothetical protein BTM25_31270 [Actinomadura rubteroloni]|uniref:Secreted protein n=1 Tax=Actinomadura rubteroloni TaxID=1926885 RepID=A0A2P4UHL6_9ACTN|nr:hypothetical protein [Actinomadura rubteroloni]POM24498.1 hypothetical protein BTM25_31270 [Actinomadura rubteroloni]